MPHLRAAKVGSFNPVVSRVLTNVLRTAPTRNKSIANPILIRYSQPTPFTGVHPLHRLLRCAFLPLALCINLLPAQNLKPATEDMRKNLSEATHAADLESAGTLPFHLAASFETYDYLGKPDGTGTLTEDWLSPLTYRRTLTYRGATSTRTATNGTIHYQDSGFKGSFPERRIIQALFQPGPDQERLDQAAFSSSDLKLGKIVLNCLSVSPSGITEKNSPSEKAPTAFCLSQNPPLIRTVLDPYGVDVVYNSLLSFSRHTLAKEVRLSHNGLNRAVLHVTDFAPAPILKESDFFLEGATGTATDEISLPPAIAAGHILVKKPPSYPDGAKWKHISGDVILAAIIDKEGNVANLEVISSPDPSLTTATVNAVKQWRYTPYLINGESVQIDTTITVNYSFSSR